MTEQRSLNFHECGPRTATALPPVSRRTDPATSKQAEAEHDKRASYCDRLEKFIRIHPGSINAELAERSGLSLYETTKRVSDLVTQKRARYGAPKRNPASGRMCQTVWPPE